MATREISGRWKDETFGELEPELDGGGDEAEEKELGLLLKFDEVMRETERRGIALPEDMLEAAKSVGIRKLFLLRYLDRQGSVWVSDEDIMHGAL